MNKKNSQAKPQSSQQNIDLTDAEAARRAFIASEIFNKKYE